MIASSSTGDKIKKKRSYPKLMRSDSLVVLFTKEGVGTVVHKHRLNNKLYTVGDHVSCWMMENFQETDEVITLCSKEKS